MKTPEPKIVTIVGPTASGKSQLSLFLAKALNGAIISTDSMQVYKQLDIGTAKPSLADQAAVPHHMIDIVMPDEHYSVGHYEKDVDQIIANLTEQEIPIFLVGGTGLYFRCTLHGLCPTPEIPKVIKEQIQSWHQKSLEFCYSKLLEHDPLGAKTIHPNDTTRILRALEVVLSTGKSIRDFQQDHGFKSTKYQAISLGYQHERNELYRLINKRTHAMLKSGLIEEVENLLKVYPTDLQSLQAIGYKQVIQYLQQKITKEEMIAQIQQKTRNYAKRQLTWFRKDAQTQWFPLSENSKILEKVKVFLEI